MNASAGTRVWLDDRHAIFRLGMATCLRDGGCVIAGESSALDPMPIPRAMDVLIFESHVTALRRAVRLVAGSNARLIAVVEQPTEAQVSDLVGAGVNGILPREDLNPRSVTAYVHAVSSGSTALPQQLFRRLLTVNQNQPAMADWLCGRERDVLRLLAEGLDTHQIALDLCFSERTVKNVVHDVLIKLNCRTRAHAVAHATRAGVI